MVLCTSPVSRSNFEGTYTSLTVCATQNPVHTVKITTCPKQLKFLSCLCSTCGPLDSPQFKWLLQNVAVSLQLAADDDKS